MQKCAALFAEQHSVATDRQVRATGISLRQQKALLASGVWTRHCLGVIGPSGAPDTWERRVKIATLAVPGAVACGRTAARIHNLDGFRRFLPASRRARSGQPESWRTIGPNRS